MSTNERADGVETTEDLAEALRSDPEAKAIWDRLPARHRRGRIIASQRVAEGEVRAQRIEPHHSNTP